MYFIRKPRGKEDEEFAWGGKVTYAPPLRYFDAT